MKAFFKENLNKILLLVLASLIFIFWGRVIYSEIRTNVYTKGLDTLNARINCVASYGWNVDGGSEVTETVQIPEEFDAVYREYNKLQKLCGFDLTKFRGKSVTRYTYRVTNFPYETGAEVFVNILVYEGTMIGGDCMTTALDGFMLPIDRRFAP